MKESLMRQFVEALEKQGLTSELAQLVKKDEALAREMVGLVRGAFSDLFNLSV